MIAMRRLRPEVLHSTDLSQIEQLSRREKDDDDFLRLVALRRYFLSSMRPNYLRPPPPTLPTCQCCHPLPCNPCLKLGVSSSESLT